MCSCDLVFLGHSVLDLCRCCSDPSLEHATEGILRIPFCEFLPHSGATYGLLVVRFNLRQDGISRSAARGICICLWFHRHICFLLPARIRHLQHVFSLHRLVGMRRDLQVAFPTTHSVCWCTQGRPHARPPTQVQLAYVEPSRSCFWLGHQGNGPRNADAVIRRRR